MRKWFSSVTGMVAAPAAGTATLCQRRSTLCAPANTRYRRQKSGQDDRTDRLGRAQTLRLPRRAQGQVERGLDIGYTQPDIERGRAFIPKMQWDTVMKDAGAALDNVKSSGKVGIVGYCWGGTVSWMAAARLEGLACAVCYYGGGIPNNAGEKPKCPVMFHWGETDQSIPIEAAKNAAAQHPGAQSFVYPAGHGFNCDQRGSYNAESAKLARSRTLEFFRKHIG